MMPNIILVALRLDQTDLGINEHHVNNVLDITESRKNDHLHYIIPILLYCALKKEQFSSCCADAALAMTMPSVSHTHTKSSQEESE